MKFACFGYIAPGKVESMSESERDAFVDKCFAYDDFLRSNGHFAGGQALQPGHTAKSLRRQDGQLLVIDGPYAETKEFIGGLLILEARDIQHAVELMSNHPGSQMGPWEIRPIADMCEMVKESQERRARAVAC